MAVVEPSQRSLQRVCSLVHQLSVVISDWVAIDCIFLTETRTSDGLGDGMRTAQKGLDVTRAEIGSDRLSSDKDRE